jgi:hypothetical protein
MEEIELFMNAYVARYRPSNSVKTLRVGDAIVSPPSHPLDGFPNPCKPMPDPSGAGPRRDRHAGNRYAQPAPKLAEREQFTHQMCLPFRPLRGKELKEPMSGPAVSENLDLSINLWANSEPAAFEQQVPVR